MVGTLALISRLLEQMLRRGEMEDQLSVLEISVLGQIDRGNELPSGVARALHIDPARVTRITDRLVALGYLDRQTDSADRRRCVLRLTPAGETRVAEGRTDLSRAMNSVLDGLRAEDRSALMHHLETVRQLIDGRH
jgi:DNA-binding MarR family transcriptional regulator